MEFGYIQLQCNANKSMNHEDLFLFLSSSPGGVEHDVLKWTIWRGTLLTLHREYYYCQTTLLTHLTCHTLYLDYLVRLFWSCVEIFSASEYKHVDVCVSHLAGVMDKSASSCMSRKVECLLNLSVQYFTIYTTARLI